MHKLILTLFTVAALVLAAVAFPTGADAQPDSVVPYHMEPQTVCGSALHDRIGGPCTPTTSTSLVAIGAQVCPQLSPGRFDGKLYDYQADPLALYSYNDGPRLSLLQAEENRRTWDTYCARPLASIPTPTPAPTPAPTTAPVFECPAGYVFDGVSSSGSPRCVVVPSATPSNPSVPVFTG